MKESLTPLSVSEISEKLALYKGECEKIQEELDLRNPLQTEPSDFLYYKLRRKKKEIQSAINQLQTQLDPNDIA